jgi:hypothetical protein
VLSLAGGWIVCAIAVFMMPMLPQDERFSVFAVSSAMWTLVCIV